MKELVEDIEDVNEERLGSEDEEEESGYTVKGEIVSVISVSEYNSYRFCRSKVVDEDDGVAECTKCGALMRISLCEKMQAAKFVVTDEREREVVLSAFNPILSRIVDGISGVSLSRKLMKVPKKVYRCNVNKVVFSVKDIEK